MVGGFETGRVEIVEEAQGALEQLGGVGVRTAILGVARGCVQRSSGAVPIAGSLIVHGHFAGDAGFASCKEAAEAIADYPGIQLLDVRVGDRKAFANASGNGLHVEEMEKRDQKACLEIERLRNALFDAMSVSY